MYMMVPQWSLRPSMKSEPSSTTYSFSDAIRRGRPSLSLTVVPLMVAFGIVGCTDSKPTEEIGSQAAEPDLVADAASPSPYKAALPSPKSAAAPTQENTVTKPTLITKAPQSSPGRKNRLSKETSPYLLQHAENPVDWFPWGEEALAKAKRENKPIFLSIGYSSCHWCHVMEAESFTDKEIASYLNENFVCIKVDREERPDVDSIYMMSVNIMTGSGGWPLSVFLSPEGKPFFGGTYFPARDGDRGRGIGFLTIAKRVRDTWNGNRDAVEKSATQLTALVKSELEGAPPAADVAMPTEATLTEIQSALAQNFDPMYGGFGAQDPNAPKFPSTPNLAFLVDRVKRTQDPDALKMLTTTLDRMAMGGMRDHLGGGFHRYSVDRFWHIPHFEKMLYDNGQLASVYAEAFALTQKDHYRDVLVEMMEFLSREMTADHGGFYSALDADSEHVEGKFYRWERAEWDKVLGRSDAAIFAEIYAEQGKPNFEDEFYVPQFESPFEDLAKKPSLATGLNTVLAPMRERLLQARAARVRPMTDTKILTSWNGMMIRGLADTGRILNISEYVNQAAKAAEFLLNELRDDDGRLYRTFSVGEARLNAYVDDYANLVDGLIALHQATGADEWLDHADDVTQKQIELFLDHQNGAFFYTSSDHETLIARGKQFTDNARPSGNAISAQNLLYLAKHLDKPAYLKTAEATIKAAMPIVNRAPTAAPSMGISIANWLAKP